jgi:tetratricopeptide (TPR) repeat protein
MAQIGLRVYDREIESMIDRGQIDEAIAHSKHILKEFPKHIETYRLLGKCYLESQRYIEAADILQRVLSVYPDDFISHIGMSIICEDENNLEKAIWHMERALEVQPSNSAVNSELRRLMTLRDGAEPSKVHLSQGAYIRMCVKSGLHEQAIAEAKSALSKEPQRIDLDLILARMYSETGQKSSALDQLTIILNKLPYCYDANLLMVQILVSTNRTGESITYKDRLIAIDPYYAFVSAESPSPDLVLDDAVSVEKNEWQYSDDDTQRHTKILGQDWQDAKGPLATSGVTTKSFNQDSLPTELSDESMIPSVEELMMAGAAEQVLESQQSEYEEEKTQEFKELRQEPAPVLEPSPTIPESEVLPQAEVITETQIEEPKLEESATQEIPDWMKAAGWMPSDGQVEEAPAVENLPSEPVPTNEIPEWIKTMAPVESAPSPEELAQESEKMELLEKILPGTPESTMKENSEPLVAGTGSGFDGLRSQESTGSEITFESLGIPQQPEPVMPEPVQESAASSTDEAPDWMNLAQVSEQAEPTPILENTPEPSLPVWMSLDDAMEEEKLEFPDQKSLASLAEQTGETIEPTAGSELPDWLNSNQSQTSESQVSSMPEEFQTSQEMVASEAPDIYSSSTREEESLPTWMAPADGVAAAASFQTDEDIPEWLREEEPFPSENPSISDETLISTPISMIDANSGKVEPSAPHENTEIPDWLKEVNTDQNLVLSIPDEDILPEWAKPSASPEQQGAVIPESVVESFIAASVLPSSEEPKPSESEQQGINISELASFTQPSAEEPVSSQGLDSLLDQLSQGGFVNQNPPVENAEEAAPVAETSSAAFDLRSDLLQQEDSPFIDTDTYEEDEPRVDETLVSKPFIEFEKQVEPQSTSDTPNEVLPEIGEPLPQTDVSQPVEVEPAISDLDYVQGQQEAGQFVQPIMESEVLDQQIPDDTLDITADIDIESWLNSLQEENVIPGVEPTNLAKEQGEDIQNEIFQQFPQTEVVEPAKSNNDLPPADTAPLVGYADEVKLGGGISPLDELEEAGHFQSLPPVEDLVESLRPEEIIQPTESAVVKVEEIVQTSIPVLIETTDQKVPQTYEEWLDSANSSISDGNLDEAITVFESLIKRGDNLELTIQNLRSAVYRFPSEVSVWQVLGDGYAKSNRLQEALDAYTKAEELIR